MARRPRSSAPAMEPRGSIDPRVQFVPVPNARRLIRAICDEHGGVDYTDGPLEGSLVWLDPRQHSAEAVATAARALECHGATVRVLPREAEDAPLPSTAGTPAPLSDVSEVRPVVAELIAELPEALRAPVTECVEGLLASAGL